MGNHSFNPEPAVLTPMPHSPDFSPNLRTPRGAHPSPSPRHVPCSGTSAGLKVTAQDQKPESSENEMAQNGRENAECGTAPHVWGFAWSSHAPSSSWQVSGTRPEGLAEHLAPGSPAQHTLRGSGFTRFCFSVC